MQLTPDAEYESELGRVSYRAWFRAALTKLVQQGESFSGLITGAVDDEDDLISCDWPAFDRVMAQMIGVL